MEIPRYKCHKEVGALKIKTVSKNGIELTFEETDKQINVNAQMIARYTPKPGDYLVIYNDDYMSISPAKAFEEGYTRI